MVLDLNDLLRNLEKMLARLIGEDIALKFDLAEDLGRVTVDPGQLEQVVTNLVVNARDAMPQGGGTDASRPPTSNSTMFSQGTTRVSSPGSTSCSP